MRDTHVAGKVPDSQLLVEEQIENVEDLLFTILSCYCPTLMLVACQKSVKAA